MLVPLTLATPPVTLLALHPAVVSYLPVASLTFFYNSILFTKLGYYFLHVGLATK